MTVIIDKIAFLLIENQKLLFTLSEGKDVWYIPGGKKEKGETDKKTLIREVKEELNVDILTQTIEYYSTFLAQAHGKPKGTLVQMTCYFAEFKGELKPSSEIAKIDFITYSQKNSTAPVDQIILKDLKNNGLIK